MLTVSSADITIANSFDPDQARQNVVPNMEPSCLTLNFFLEKVNFEKNQQTAKYPASSLYIYMTLPALNCICRYLPFQTMRTQIRLDKKKEPDLDKK